MKIFIRESFIQIGGWGNGYVLIPKGHPLHGKNYDDIDVDVNGGLTLSEPANELNWLEIAEEDKEGWVVGFDTAHCGDNIDNWPKERVQEEANSLLKQLEELGKIIA